MVKKLPTSVLLGRDVPELVWIGSSKHAAEEALAATTRAQAKRKREEEESAFKKKDSGLRVEFVTSASYEGQCCQGRGVAQT